MWSAPHERGTVVYIGWDWRSYAWPTDGDGGEDWTQVLELSVGTAGTAAAGEDSGTGGH